jgi:hypothetical protein
VPLADRVVAVADPNLGHLVQQVPRGVRRVDVAGARVGTDAEQGQESPFAELAVQRELVVHLGNPVIRGSRARHVHVMAAGIEAGSHHGHVGGRQRSVQEDVATGLADGARDGGAVSSIQLHGPDPGVVEPVRQKGGAGGHRIGNHELLESCPFAEFEGGHGPHRAGT